MNEQVYIEVRPFTEDEADPGFLRMGPMDRRRAERVDAGVNRNLNHERYYTLIVSTEAGRSALRAEREG